MSANQLTFGKSLGFEQITGLTAAKALTVPTGARIAVLHAEAQAIRWRDDGSNPTAGIGMRLTVGQHFVFDGNLATIKFIEETATAKLNVSYYD